MTFHNVNEALHALEDFSSDHETHIEARQYLANLDDCEETKNLVKMFESEDLGIRWKAAEILSRMGKEAVCAVAKAIMDPDRVGDPLLRESVVHLIHIFEDEHLKQYLKPLEKVLKSHASNTEIMWEAYHLLQKMDPNCCK